MDKLAPLREKRQEILEIARRHRAYDLVAINCIKGVCGYDILCKMQPDSNYFHLSGLLVDLRKFLGYDVDILTYELLIDTPDGNREKVYRACKPI